MSTFESGSLSGLGPTTLPLDKELMHLGYSLGLLNAELDWNDGGQTSLEAHVLSNGEQLTFTNCFFVSIPILLVF